MAGLDWGRGFLKRLPYSGSPMTEEEKLVAGKQAGQSSAAKNGFVPERKAESVPHTDASATDVYAVHGADPEVLAYAMAKYSRSSLTMRESLKEISSQKAEQFLDTFYFQYGHRSIADLAHVAFAIERLSLLAAIELVDEQRWDGQERSTRYQNFKKSGWYTPDFGGDGEARQKFGDAVAALFAAYEHLSGGMTEYLKTQVARPETMKEDAFERTLRARAFDVARYLLPLATNTSLGQIVNARTLETQISRLLSSEFGEVRVLGERLRQAAAGAAWNVRQAAADKLAEKVIEAEPALAAEVAEVLQHETRVAPTLVKYSAPNAYEMETRKELTQAARELMQGVRVEAAPLVDLVEDRGDREDALEVELAVSLLYPYGHYSYRQLRDTVEDLHEARRREIVELGTRNRGRHDELLRGFSSGQALKFDILMDIGGFRDMHRHRRCVQLRQGYTTEHGFAVPEGVAEAGLHAEYDGAVGAALKAAEMLRGAGEKDALYLLPLGVRCRTMFKMDFAEAVYISELRSQPQGHFSYREVAWEMYRAVERQHPALAKFFRVTDVREPVDLLKR
jgi:thymidylate synthase ThyX